MRKTIYVPDQEIWDRVVRDAEENNLSVSQFLLGRIIPLSPIAENPILEQIRLLHEKIDKLM